MGLLEVWFKYNPLLWQVGLCISSDKEISINKQIIYTLTGPLASLAIAIIACYFTFVYDSHGLIKLILVFSLSSSIFDLFVNLIPSTSPIKLYNGNLAYNDGYIIKQLFYYKRFPKDYKLAVQFYNQQNFAESAAAFNDILERGFKTESIYRLTISSFLQVKNYKRSKELSDEFMVQNKMNSDDFANAGVAYFQLDQYDYALELYDKSLQLNPENQYALNNKGFVLNLLNKFEEAIPLFDKAIEIDETFAYSYNNRGLAKIKIGKTEEGLEDINHSLKLDEYNSYGYCNLGIYHFDKGEYLKALELFEKAKSLYDTTYKIDELIDKATKNIMQ